MMVEEVKETGKAPEVPGSAQGLGGPNPTPTFGNNPQTDNNRPVEKQSDLDSFVEGAEAASAIPGQTADELLAAAGAVEAKDDHVQYASPHIARLKLGPYQFENGRLEIHKDKVDHFEKLLRAASPRTQQAVRKIDREGGEAVARRFLEQTNGKRFAGISTSDQSPAAPNPADQQHKA